MFRANLAKQTTTDHLDSLIAKGYLNARTLSARKIKDSLQALNLSKSARPLQVI
jgi:DNA-binding MarR family transcriptional regulator